MNRYVLIILSVALCLGSVGCCGPRGCGIGCGISSCYDCDGAGYGEPFVPQRPLDGIRQLRKQLVCGSGCGEVYVDEWISTPPDCTDPCAGTDFVGGATPCQPSCWQPGSLLQRLLGVQWYGVRHCSGDASSASCGCDSCTGGAPGFSSHSLIAAASRPIAGASCGCGSSHVAPVAIPHAASRSVPKRDTITKQR